MDKQTLFKQLSGNSSILRPLQLKLDRSCTLPTQASMTATLNNVGPIESRKNSNVLGTMSNLDEPSVTLP